MVDAEGTETEEEVSYDNKKFDAVDPNFPG